MGYVVKYDLKTDQIVMYDFANKATSITIHPSNFVAESSDGDKIKIINTMTDRPVVFGIPFDLFVDETDAQLGVDKTATLAALNALSGEGWYDKGYPVDDGGVTKRIKVVGGIINIGLL